MPRGGGGVLTEYLFEGERVRTLPDLLAPGLRLLFVGFNPSVRAARLGRYYAGRNNRFWDLLAASGLTPERWSFERDRELLELGIGVTDLVKRPTRSAAEVTAEEFRRGAERFRGLVRELRPRVVCYNGKGVYLRAAGVQAAPWGRQERSLVEGTVDFVAPSPSGLARIRFAEKARWFTELRAVVDSMEA
ncbi:MAG TPA: mismatch-specific DNA-glycosylase [Longimicrobiaceae bacterium]|nr:mismatch-specific DNA-glycosylase [Longimicrobiaceae bacterium]